MPLRVRLKASTNVSALGWLAIYLSLARNLYDARVELENDTAAEITALVHFPGKAKSASFTALVKQMTEAPLVEGNERMLTLEEV